MANIKSHGAYKIGTHKITRHGAEGDPHYVDEMYTLCSDGRVLVKYQVRYYDRRYSATANYKLWGRINDPEKRNMAFLVKLLDKREEKRKAREAAAA